MKYQPLTYILTKNRYSILIFAMILTMAVKATGQVSVYVRPAKNASFSLGEKVETGMKILRTGTNYFSCVVHSGEPEVEGGVILVLIDRPYKPEVSNTIIPPNISLRHGEKMSGRSWSPSRRVYTNYHQRETFNQSLRNGFHQNFGKKQRTDDPSRRRNFLFRDESIRNYRTVMLFRYNRSDSESINDIKFSVGYSSDQTEAVIKIVDLKDGVLDPVSHSVTLLQK